MVASPDAHAIDADGWRHAVAGCERQTFDARIDHIVADGPARVGITPTDPVPATVPAKAIQVSAATHRRATALAAAYDVTPSEVVARAIDLLDAAERAVVALRADPPTSPDLWPIDNVEGGR